jgi:phosphomethylpyrimidine synthase
MHLQTPLGLIDPQRVTLRSSGGEVEVGSGRPTRIMALVGASHGRSFDESRRRVEILSKMPDGPDILGDLSILPHSQARHLWKVIRDQTPFVAASLPVYSVTSRKGKIDHRELRDVAVEQIESGVGLVTIHPTPTVELVRLAEKRLVPWTSRGGGLVIKDLAARNWRGENAYLRILPEIIDAARHFGTILSLGASFRSASIIDSYDEAQKAEIEAQLDLAAQITSEGVGVIVESPGHARPADIRRVAAHLRKAPYPIMPLGPMPTDSAIGQDHVAAAIGATLFGLEGCAQILAAVTREEHTGGVPSLDSTIEAIQAARVAAHVIDLDTLGDDRSDRLIATQRAMHHTCIAGKETPGCSRCSDKCPL